jgi:hypothetical protein
MRFTLDPNSKRANALLWTVQALLALVYLFTGGLKLTLPIAALTQATQVPGPFLRFIGACEVLGAIGLILPGLLRIRPGLTPLAATGLTIIMIGAIGATLASGLVAPALIPAALGLLAAFVAYGRRGLLTAPDRRKAPSSARPVETAAASA